METWPNQKEHVSTTAVRTSLTMSQGFRVVNNGGTVQFNSQTQSRLWVQTQESSYFNENVILALSLSHWAFWAKIQFQVLLFNPVLFIHRIDMFRSFIYQPLRGILNQLSPEGHLKQANSSFRIRGQFVPPKARNAYYDKIQNIILHFEWDNLQFEDVSYNF